MHTKRSAAGAGIQLTQLRVIYQGGSPNIVAQVSFTATQPALAVFAVAIKILPVIYYLGYQYKDVDKETGEQIPGLETPDTAPLIFDKLQDWNALRSKALTLPTEQYVALNTWKIAAKWNISQLVQYPEQFYYQTAYSRFPQQIDSDSLSS